MIFCSQPRCCCALIHPTPGPADYQPESPSDHGPAWTMGARPAEPRADPRDAVPPPGAYQLPASPTGPAYSFRGRPEPPSPAVGA